MLGIFLEWKGQGIAVPERELVGELGIVFVDVHMTNLHQRSTRRPTKGLLDFLQCNGIFVRPSSIAEPVDGFLGLCAKFSLSFGSVEQGREDIPAATFYMRFRRRILVYAVNFWIGCH